MTSASAQGPATSVKFYSGWYVSETSDTPEILNIGLDRASYRPGDELKVQVQPRMAGEALVAIVSDRVLATQTIKVSASGGTASFKVDASWGPGAYATAIAYRPMDSAAKRMPGRAVGTKWIPLDIQPRTLAVALDTPLSVRPAGPVTVSATVSGLDAGENATIVISGVDLGILNITRYKTPQPEAYFLAQRRLGLEMRDLYGKLIDGMQGTRGAVRSGGDEGGMEMAPAARRSAACGLFRPAADRWQRQGAGDVRAASLQRHDAACGASVVCFKGRAWREGRDRSRYRSRAGHPAEVPDAWRHIPDAPQHRECGSARRQL